MTDTEYLQALNVLEGVGDKSGIPTSKKYGITANGIATVCQAIRKKEGGDYIESAKQIQEVFGDKMSKALLNSITWSKKEGKMTKWASLKDVEKFGEEGLGKIALAMRQIHKNEINRIPAAPMSEEAQDRLCLSAHNRPSVLKDKDIRSAIEACDERLVMHEAMNNLKGVSEGNMLGIKRRQAALFNPDYQKVSVIDAWNSFDKKGPAFIGHLVNEAYEQENTAHANRIKETSDNQAIASQYNKVGKMDPNAKPFPNEDVFLKSLFPKPMTKVKEPAQKPIAAPKPAKEPSFWEKVGRAAMTALNPFYGLSSGNSNQVAQNEENILNNPNGEKV